MAAEKRLKQLWSQGNLRSILIKQKTYKAMTVAGSDPCGGAGIQADLKTFCTFDVYGTAVVTALTAQNTCGVSGIHPVPADFVALQMTQVLEDLGPMPLKTGMLADRATVDAVRGVVEQFQLHQLVVDPVLVSTSGDPLVQEDTLEALRKLIARATLVTPNLHEAGRLAGIEVRDMDSMREAAFHIFQTGVKHVLIKGGHLNDEATDLFFDGQEYFLLKEKRLPLGDTHGTGCAYAAAVVAGLSREMPLLDAVINAKIYITRALRFSLEVGRGSRVLNFKV